VINGLRETPKSICKEYYSDFWQHIPLAIHLIKEIKPITNSAKKNATIETNITTDINSFVNTIDSAANAVIIVPMIPAKRHDVFLHTHFCNAVCGFKAAKNTPTIKTISAKIPIPNAIQVEVTMKGIKSNAKRMPIMAPNTTLNMIPMQLQAVQPQSLLDPIFSHLL